MRVSGEIRVFERLVVIFRERDAKQELLRNDIDYLFSKYIMFFVLHSFCGLELLLVSARPELLLMLEVLKKTDSLRN